MNVKIGRGILYNISKNIKEINNGNTCKVAVITDDNVDRLYSAQIVDSLEDEGFKVTKLVIPNGEESKNGENYLKLLNDLAEIPLTRTDLVLALGGGVVGDLAGFVAATYLRGLRIIQVPTTLLAAVDSSVGGKTAINLPSGKNLAGAFHQPKLVWCDVETFDTLSDDILRDGMAEVIKYAIIKDKKLFNILKDRNNLEIEKIVETCIEIKSKLVEKDERDIGVRQLLNFGHTMGHAIEKASNYRVSHGSAVAKGMAIITDISKNEGWLAESQSEEIINLLETYDFDLHVGFEKTQLINIMERDKKRKGNNIDLVITRKIGTSELESISIEELGKLLWKIELR